MRIFQKLSRLMIVFFIAGCLDSAPENELDTARDPSAYSLLIWIVDNYSPFGGVETLGVSFQPLPAILSPIFKDGQSSVVFQDRVYVIGVGAGNEIWSSVDGVQWTNEVNNVFPGGGRAMATALVFNGRIYYIGGSPISIPGPVPANQSVWSSVDGRNWVNAAPGCVSCPGAGIGFVFQGQMWFLDSTGSTIFSSPDGVNWNPAPTNISIDPLFALVFQGTAYLFDAGGSIWASANGSSWTRRVFKVGPVHAGRYLHGTVFDDRMWLLEDVKYDGANAVSALNPFGVLFSSDGRFWDLVDVGCCNRSYSAYFYSVEVFRNHIWLIGQRFDPRFRTEAGVAISLGEGAGVSGSGITDFSL